MAAMNRSCYNPRQTAPDNADPVRLKRRAVKYTSTQQLTGTMREVLAIAKDRTRDVEIYPNIKNMRQVKWEETDTDIHCEYIARGGTEIPKPLQKLITEKMLSWREVGHWDKGKNTYDYRIRTFYFPNAFHMSGILRFTKNGADGIQCLLEGDIRVDVPLLGPLIDKTVVKYQLENLAEEAKRFDTLIAALRKKRKR